MVGVAVREPRLLDAGFVVVADLIVDLLDLGGLLLDEDKVLLLFVVVALIDFGLSAVPEETAVVPDFRLGEIGMFSPVGLGFDTLWKLIRSNRWQRFAVANTNRNAKQKQHDAC